MKKIKLNLEKKLSSEKINFSGNIPYKTPEYGRGISTTSPNWPFSDERKPIPKNILKDLKAHKSFSERLKKFREQYNAYENMLIKNPGLKRTIIKSYQ